MPIGLANREFAQTPGLGCRWLQHDHPAPHIRGVQSIEVAPHMNHDFATPWRGEIVIHVGRDLDGLHAAYVRRGVVVLEPPTTQPWGLREFAIREPDGHVLRFCGYL